MLLLLLSCALHSNVPPGQDFCDKADIQEFFRVQDCRDYSVYQYSEVLLYATCDEAQFAQKFLIIFPTVTGVIVADSLSNQEGFIGTLCSDKDVTILTFKTKR